MSVLLKSLNILIYPYVFSAIKKEIYQIIQYKKDLLICKNGGDPNKKLTPSEYDEIDNKTGQKYKNNQIIYYLSILLIITLVIQSVMLFLKISNSMKPNKYLNLLLLILFMSVSIVMPIIILVYYNSSNKYISNSFNPLVKTTILQDIPLISFIFYIAIFANIGYTLLYNSVYFINIIVRD